MSRLASRAGIQWRKNCATHVVYFLLPVPGKQILKNLLPIESCHRIFATSPTMSQIPPRQSWKMVCRWRAGGSIITPTQSHITWGVTSSTLRMLGHNLDRWPTMLDMVNKSFRMEEKSHQLLNLVSYLSWHVPQRVGSGDDFLSLGANHCGWGNI